MAKFGPILILEDDHDDQHFLEEAFQLLKVENQLKFFTSAPAALTFLLETKEQPFLILSDINLPGMSGIDFRKEIEANEYLRRKSIPFVFLSTGAGVREVNMAYLHSVQGFFIKPTRFDELKDLIHIMVTYWQNCVHPNKLT